MGWLRRTQMYRADIHPYRDSDAVVTIQWYPAGPKAKVFPLYHMFGPGVYMDRPSGPWSHVGEIEGTRRYVRKFTPPIYPGTCFMGDADQWQGLTQADKLKPIVRPECCRPKFEIDAEGQIVINGPLNTLYAVINGVIIIYGVTTGMIIRDYQAGGLFATFAGVDIVDVDEYDGIEAIEITPGEVKLSLPEGTGNATLIQYNNGHKRFNNPYQLVTTDAVVGIPSHQGIVDVDCTAGDITLTMSSATSVGSGYRVWVRKVDHTTNRLIIDFGTDSFLRGGGRTTLETITPYDAYLLGTAKYGTVDGVAHAWQVLAIAPTAAQIPSNPPSGGSGLLDHFTDTDGTLLTAHTMDSGPGWTVGAGTWSISADIAKIDNTAVHGSVYSDLGSADGTGQVTVTPLTSATNAWRLGLAFRVQDANNYLWAAWSNDNDGTIYLRKRVGGTNTAIDQFIVGTGAIGTPATVKVVTSGLFVHVYLDGTLRITQTVTEFSTQTKWGLYVDNQFATESTGAFDDFSAVL